MIVNAYSGTHTHTHTLEDIKIQMQNVVLLYIWNLLQSSCSGYRRVAAFCEHNNERLAFTKTEVFLNYVNECPLLDYYYYYYYYYYYFFFIVIVSLNLFSHNSY
jgi:hypothetical protein